MSRVDMLGEQSFFFLPFAPQLVKITIFFGDIFHLLIMLFHTLFAHSYNHHSPPSIKLFPSLFLQGFWGLVGQSRKCWSWNSGYGVC